MYINIEALTEEEKDTMILALANKIQIQDEAIDEITRMYTAQKRNTLECTEFLAHLSDEITSFIIGG